MRELPNSLIFLLLSWGATTAALSALVIYRTSLSRAEDDSLYLNKAKEFLLVGEQNILQTKMNRLRRPILTLGALSAAQLFAIAVLWIWTGYSSF